MNARATVILLVLFFAGLIGLWWADSARVPTAEQRRWTAGRVLPELVELRPSDIRRVEVSGGDAPPLIFERREGDAWEMTAPVRALASSPRIEALIRHLRELTRSPDAGTVEGDPSKYGLARPSRVVRLFGPRGKAPLAALELGRVVADRRYVRPVGRSTIEVVGNELLAAFDEPAVAWRERSLFGIGAFDVTAIRIDGSGRAWEVRRVEERWRVIRPIQAPGDRPKIEGVLASLTGVDVVAGLNGFVEGASSDLATYGLDPPALTVRLTTATAPARPQTVHVGRPVPDRPGHVYARREGGDEVMIVPARAFEALPHDAHALRSRRVADLRLERVDCVRVEAGGQTHLLARGPEGWRVLQPSPAPGDGQAIEEFLTGINTLQAELKEASEVRDPGFDSPTMTITVWEDGLPDVPPPADATPSGPPALTLHFGRQSRGDRLVYARAEGDPVVLVLPYDAADLVPDGPLAFHARRMLAFDPRRVRRLEIVRAGQRVALAESAAGPEGGWSLTAPIRAPADPQNLARLITALSSLRARGLVRSGPGDLKVFGLDEPGLQVSWDFRERGDSPSAKSSSPDGRLVVGGAVAGRAGSRYAKIDGDETIFTIDARTFDALTAESRDRQVFRFAVEQVARLTLRWPSRAVTLVRKPRPLGGPARWEPEPGTVATGIEMSDVDGLATLLSALRTPNYVRYDGPFPTNSGLDAPALAVDVELTGGFGARHLRLGRADLLGNHRFATADTGASGSVFLLPAAAWEPWILAGNTPRELPKAVFAR